MHVQLLIISVQLAHTTLIKHADSVIDIYDISLDPIALCPPSISASSTMGKAILLGACVTGLRGPLDWEPAEVAGTDNVVSKAGSQGAGSHGAGCDDDSTKI